MSFVHGGDTEGYKFEYGSEPLDFSANCNPLGIPPGVPEAIAKTALHADKYPDPLCRRLRAALSHKLDIPAERILCGNGAADLIFRLANGVKPETAAITAPTFSEYEQALAENGCGVRHHLLKPENGFAVTEAILDEIRPGLDMLFICNPNNPTGLTVEPSLLRRVLDACRDSGTLLIVDECFNGFLDAPEKHSLRGALDRYDNLLILDAFTKIYGMAGVRLGYCMTGSEALLDAMKRAGPPWPVSSLAQEAGIAALKADNHVGKARSLVRSERAFLTERLRSLGIDAIGGEANYIFFRSEIPDLAGGMRGRGILIRDCSNYIGLRAGYYRIAVRTREENKMLTAALKEICHG
jgi:threonine-phosphate decarboxylase